MSRRYGYDMPYRCLENHGQSNALPSEAFVGDRADASARSQNVLDKLGIYRLICGGLMFIGLTVGIFWFQFSKIPAGNPPEVWSQLQWRYLLWLLLFLPVDTVAAGLRIYVIGRVLQPGVSLWTCLKAEWANLGLAMLTPSQTGGGFGQMYMLSRGGMRLGTALTVSLVSFLGSMVVLLFVGLYALMSSSVAHLNVPFKGAFVVFFVVFAGLMIAVCWPGSVRRAARAMTTAVCKIEVRSCLPQNSGIRRLSETICRQSKKCIDLCYHHQANMHRYFRLSHSNFLWVCLLSLVFLLARAVMAFLCLRFLGIPVAEVGRVLQTQMCLIFLIYFAPTPGSSGLAEGASVSMMDGIISAGFVPYYNLLWRSLTLYLPAVAGLIFLLWAIVKDTRNAVDRRARKRVV
jgi:uncharacterized protein (TIRG00374 family)